MEWGFTCGYIALSRHCPSNLRVGRIQSLSRAQIDGCHVASVPCVRPVLRHPRELFNTVPPVIGSGKGHRDESIVGLVGYVNTSIHQYTNTSIHQYINTSIHQYTNTPIGSIHQNVQCIISFNVSSPAEIG